MKRARFAERRASRGSCTRTHSRDPSASVSFANTAIAVAGGGGDAHPLPACPAIHLDAAWVLPTSFARVWNLRPTHAPVERR